MVQQAFVGICIVCACRWLCLHFDIQLIGLMRNSSVYYTKLDLT